jgi:hypothetical protein
MGCHRGKTKRSDCRVYQGSKLLMTEKQNARGSGRGHKTVNFTIR